MTRHFEDEMEEIREGKRKKNLSCKKLKKHNKVVGNFRKHEKDVGESLKQALAS